MSDNQYENFKSGIKNDIKETGASLFLVGGLILLVIILLTVIVTVKNSNLDGGLKTIIIILSCVVLGLLIFSNKFRGYILGGWLILLAAIVILPVIALSLYLFYMAFTGK